MNDTLTPPPVSVKINALLDRLEEVFASDNVSIIQALASLALQSNEARFLALVAAEEIFGEAGFEEARCYQLRRALASDLRTPDVMDISDRLGMLSDKLRHYRFRDSTDANRCRGLTKKRADYGLCGLRPGKDAKYCHHHTRQETWCCYGTHETEYRWKQNADSICQLPRANHEDADKTALPFCTLHNTIFEADLRSIERAIDTLASTWNMLREKLELFHAENPLTVTVEVPLAKQDENCIICQEELHKPFEDVTGIEEPIVRQRGCRHLFHRSCLARWHKSRDEYGIYRSGSCPTCRQTVWDESGICGVDGVVLAPETERIAHERLVKGDDRGVREGVHDHVQDSVHQNLFDDNSEGDSDMDYQHFSHFHSNAAAVDHDADTVGGVLEHDQTHDYIWIPDANELATLTQADRERSLFYARINDEIYRGIQDAQDIRRGMEPRVQPDREEHDAALRMLHNAWGLPEPENDYERVMSNGYPPLTVEHVEGVLARARQRQTGIVVGFTAAQIADEDVDMAM